MVTICLHHVINHAGIGRDNVHVELAAQPFLNDLHVKQPEKAASETVTKGDRAFRLIDERGIVDLQLSHGRLQVLEIAGINWINSAENHWMNFLEPGQCFGSSVSLIRERVANLNVSS